MSNIGDSRAIMGSNDSNDSMVAIQLTIDLKPDLPREAERIKRCKGRVFALQDEPEVPRVWLPFDDAPGLAMARAFGDFCLKDYGVISIPEFSHASYRQRRVHCSCLGWSNTFENISAFICSCGLSCHSNVTIIAKVSQHRAFAAFTNIYWFDENISL
ncbi:probable protein phosphatase 2C 1 [Arachis stenosperma]|uniref:probable protein phosphatase 2C 1 n=1 Tax=Arachis stenosperma TaxID=217475 RepID=UPI0025ACA659|nr:probable protein phosphatase 2C 1 [Arachis stenosperma]XP_057754095.1 probable protein phosphatase 2C 1 [Arachis stenosperma]XP_057754096.1 probable protein phosphatase 2C 1 [Arachis stenosperma]